MGGTETITVKIPRNIAMNWYEMDVCLRGPGLSPRQAEISAMLRSVRMARTIERRYLPGHRVRYAV